MKRTYLVFVAVLFIPIAAVAWSPKTDQAIVSTAVRLLSKSQVIHLSKLDREVMEGASASSETLERLFPGLASGPATAVQSEMYLLDAVRGEAIDAYVAYRLGALGRLVAGMTAPFSRDNSPTRARYYADVEKALPQTSLKPSASKKVDPVAYLQLMQQAADARKEIILKDYTSGPGFDGVAHAALSEDISRSIDAVANVWYTLLAQHAVQAGVSDVQKRDYVVQAMSFYIARGNEDEIEANYRRLTQNVAKTPDVAKLVGDLLFSAGFAERAVKEYQDVLAVEPHRKDVVDRIAAYFIEQGEAALKAEHLEQALDAFTQAAKTDPLHPTAEGKRLAVAKTIEDRDARLEAARNAVDEGGRFETEAEEFILKRKFPEAFDALKKAQTAYGEVTEEFRREAQAAEAGLANIKARLGELKSEVVANAQTLSGSGFRFDVRKMAGADALEMDQNALKKLPARQLTSEMAKLKAEYQNVLAASKK